MSETTKQTARQTTLTTLTIPRLGEGIVEVRMVRLLKQPGETVAKDEVLYEMEHDKAAVEIESPTSGLLRAWLVEEGQTVPIGGAVAEIEPAGPAEPVRTEPAAEQPAQGASPLGRPGTTPAGVLRIPPRTRAHARRLGIDEDLLATVPARGNSLMPADLEAFLAKRNAQEIRPDENSPAAGMSAGVDAFVDRGRVREERADENPSAAAAGFTDVPVSARQRELNRALRGSAASVVPAVVATEIDAELLERALRDRRAEPGAGGFTTAFQVFAHLAARVAADFPQLRSRHSGTDRLRVFDHVDLGIACATDDGDLTVGVVRGADLLDEAEFGRRYADAVERALAGESQADGRVTLTLSHLGDEGATFAIPVVVAPAAATLFLGSPERSGAKAVRRAVLSFDHTIFNGREAALYLEALRTALAPSTNEDTAAVPAAVTVHEPEPAALAPAGATALERLTELAREVIGHPLDPDRPLGEQGFDSARALQLIREARRVFGVHLPATAMWRYPTLRDLAGQLPEPAPTPEQTPDATAPVTAPVTTSVTAARPATVTEGPGRPDDGIAVIGMACRVPGADGPEAYWSLLAEAGCRIGPVPPGRLAGEAPEGFRAGLLERVDLFDAAFFGISPRQAASMDPQQRALLELSWHALEHAALHPDDLAGTPVGVFAAACSYDYREQLVDRDAADGYATVGTFPAFLANRISHTYDFTGPSITIDTACSGALTALALAESAIRSGDCDIALAGAANLLSNAFNARAFQRAGMLSPHGDSRVFDAAADGFVRGEGAGWVVLKSLRKAIADGDPVLAVLRGTAVNHGGRAAALTAPNPKAQTALVRTALERAGLRAADLGFLEAHGTGTPLGDPIELEAFREALAAEPHGMPAQAAGPEGRLWVGSAKSNIGHLEGASGLAGLIKAVQVLRHQTIPGNANFTGLNPHIDLDGTPLAIADHTVAWPRVPGAAPRRAAVSAFGFGGSNAHAVLEEAPQLDPAPAPAEPGAVLAVPLSAATPGALARLAADLADLVEDGSVDLRQTAWTLQSGRRSLTHRMLITAGDPAGLAAAARAFATGQRHPCTATADHLAALDRLARTAERDLARDWLSGRSVSWSQLWTDGEPPRRIPLVPYPFQGEPFWLPAGRRPEHRAAYGGEHSGEASGEESAKNSGNDSGSDSGEEAGALVLPVDHPLASHRVGGRAIAPGALLLDTMSQAGATALRDIRFLRPVPFDRALRLTRHIENTAGTAAITVLHQDRVCARAVADQAPPPSALTPGDGRFDGAVTVDLTATLTRLGIDVGPAYRVVGEVRRAGRWATATLTAPEAEAEQARTRRIGWLDAALQTACALSEPGRPRVAAAIDRLTWTGEVPERAQVVLHRAEDGAAHDTVDLDIADAAGHPVVQVRGLLLLPAGATAADSLAADPVRIFSPEWSEEAGDAGDAGEGVPADGTVTLVLHDRHTASLAAGLALPDGALHRVDGQGVDRERLAAAVTAAAGRPLSVALLVGGARWTEDADGTGALRGWLAALLTTAQVLREAAVRAEVRLLTTGLAAPDGRPLSAGASLQGALLGALRTLPREVPRLTAAAVDLAEDLTTCDGTALARALTEPCADAVPLLALRGSRRLRQVLTERPVPDGVSGFRTGGTYVLFGGAGGIGAEVARHLAARYRASVLLVGRSAENEEIRALLGELHAAGARARYRTGDVTDTADVTAVLDDCRAAFGEPDGIVHSVGSVSDGLLTTLTSADIDHVLDTKVTAVLNLRRALRPGTSLVLFSSVAGLFGSIGGLNYAAANAFLDHYATAVDGERDLRVRAFGWGLWRDTGLARHYTAHVRRQYPGLTDFAPERGVAALEAGMSGTDAHIVAVSGDPEPLRPLTRPTAPVDPAHRLDHYARAALARTMAGLGLDRAAAFGGVDAAAARLGVVPEHRRLLAAILELLTRDDTYAPSTAELERTRDGLLADCPDLRGHVELLDRALAAYGPVLRGEQPPTGVLFPGGDLSSVSAIYSGNRLFDPVNQAAADALAAAARQLAADTGRRPRILEIGAGVGGTTAAALAALARQGVEDVEYTYTDVSQAFLHHARRRFGDRVVPRLLDIEKAPEAQDFDPGHYDLLVASNVLHATRDLTTTLRHAGRLLAPGGRMMLVELVSPAAVYTLTFGLTDGWWRFVDEQYRMPHGPLLDVARWRALLDACGWQLEQADHVREIPGCVALLRCGRPAPAPEAAASAGSAEGIREIVRELLGDPQAPVPGHLPWQELGIDSLLNMELVAAVSRRFGEISATAIFEHRTVDDLAHWIDARAAATTTPPRAAAPTAPQARAAAVAPTVGGAGLDVLPELTGIVAELTGRPAHLLDLDADFPSIGVDSLLNQELTGELRVRFPGRDIPSTVLFEHPTLRTLARHLAPVPAPAPATAFAVAEPSVIAPSVIEPPIAVRPETASPAVVPEPVRRTVEDTGARPAIAVVGLAGRYPGARDVDDFWQLLVAGHTPVTEVPADRWDWRTARTLGGGYARYGCFVEDWDRFDPELFRITPRDAAVMDPQERMFLEVAWEAFETAGYARRSLAGGAGGPRVGVFAGVTANSHLIAQHEARLAGADNPEYAVTAAASVANRVSHALDLSGPSLTVDTMCSSSLTALHLACRALRDGEADLALAGGVNLYLHPDRFTGLCALGMPSRGAHTRAFGAGGDGFVPGEGAGAVVLKRLDRAEADGDTIYAVIRGTGLNHGGGTGGYTVPNPLAQAALIGATLEGAGVEPGTVDYIEAHGTGTELGDPIELRALALAFGEHAASGTQDTVRVGSVKSNIGHGEAFAGIAGLTKAILQLRHGQLVPTLHAERINPKLELDGTPLRIQRRGELWPARTDERGRALPRRAAVSSFGAGGANAHVVLEEYRQPQPADAVATAPVVLPLSAPDAERLRTVARRLADALAPASGPERLLGGPASLADVARTLRDGRETWPHRAAVTAGDRRRLLEALTALAEGRDHPDVVTADRTPEDAPAEAVDWVTQGHQPRAAATGRRVALPTTPFARRRCTLPDAQAADGGRPVDLPLADTVHTPLSRTVTVRLGGASRWVADHVVDGAPLLPGAFHPELVYEALLTADVSPYRSTIRDLTWPAPAVGLPMTVRAELEAPDADGARRFRVDTGTEQAGGLPVAQGWTEPDGADPVRPALRYRPADLDRHLAAGGLDGEEFYRAFAGHGFAYGPLYRTVRRALRGTEETTAELRLPDGEDRDGRHVLHPALLDGACQAAAFLLLAEDPQARRRYRPLAIDRLTVFAPVTGTAYVHARRVRAAADASGIHVFDLRLIAVDSGELLAEAEGFRISVEERGGGTGVPAGSAAVAAPAGSAAVTAPAVPAAAVAPAVPAAAVTTPAAPTAAVASHPVPAADAIAEEAPALAGYRTEWREAPAAATDDAGTVWTIGGGFAADGCDVAAVRLSMAEATEAGLRAAAERTGAPATVLVDLTGEPGRLAFADRPLTSGQLPDAWRHFNGAVLEPVFGLLRTLVTCRALNGTRVLLVTEADGEPTPALRGLHSLVRTVAGETTRISPRLATVDAAWRARDPRGAAAAVAAEAAGRVPEGEDWVLLGADGVRRTAVLTPEPPLAAAEPAQLLDPRGTYLVVGGLGGLGRQIASAIRTARPTAKLVLVGRSAPDAAALDALQRESRGSVTYRQCDVTDPQQLTELCAALERSGKHLRGIVHTAGVLRDGFLRTKDPRTVEEVCRAKVLGAVAVDAAFADHPLDFFVVASSLAALVGNQGQSDYAFANGFLDGFARARARWVEQGHRRGRTLSVGWPVLDGAGMAPEPAALDYLTDTYGLRPVSAAAAVTGMWPRIAAATEPVAAHVALVAGDQSVWREALGVSAEATTDTTPPTTPTTQTVLPAQTPEPSAPVADPRAAVTDWLAQRVGRAIGVPAAMIGADRPLPEYGVDSIAVMRLGRILEEDLGRVPQALLLDSNTLTELADALLTGHGPQLTAAVAAETPPAPAPATPAVAPVSTTPAQPEAEDEDGYEDGAMPLPDRLAGMWAADQAAAPAAPYNISLAWRLVDGADRAALSGAVQDLARRHPVLASSVRPHRGELSFVPATAAPVLDIRPLPAGQDADAAVRQEADRRFALSSEPLLRAVLWESGDTAVLQLTTHHLAVDGRSAELVQQDFSALYAARAGQAPQPLPAPVFADALRRERRDAARGHADAEAFWTRRLTGLKADALFAEGGEQASAAGAHREYRLPGELSQLLSRTARSAGVTPFTVLLGAFATALGRSTGRREFLVAVPTYGRASQDEDAMIGCFVNSVPLRIDLDPARPVTDWLATLHEEVRGAVAHASLPYPRLAGLCRAAGGEDAVPTVTFAYQNWVREHDADGIAAPFAALVHRRGQRGHFDLGLEVTDTATGIDVLANHRTQILDGAAVDGLVDDIRRMVIELARADDGGARLGTLLDPGAATLVSRFADTVRRGPDRTAVEDRTETLDYAALDALSENVARRVSAACPPGEPVAVLMHRSARLVAVLLGILKTGRPYVPLDDSYPADRLEMVVTGAGCSLAVADADLARLLPADVRVLPAAEALADGAPQPADTPRTAPRPTDPAYLMFTSGSTGRPKGVSVTHGNVVHTLEAIAATTGIGAADRLLAVTTVCFDISVLELFLPLIEGGTVLVADRATVIDAGRLAATIASRDITAMQATPAGWQLLLDGGWPGREQLTALCGGEALPPNLARQLVERTGSLWNVYGPTEATIWSTIARVTDGPVHLGDPIGATDLVITEVDGTAAPAAGEPGELWIGGPAVAQGYWRQPDLTAERFTGHPASAETGGRYFRTGDLVRRDEHGRLVFLGRADSQVKIRGHRVELGEIEAVLGAHPGVSRVVLTLRGEGATARLFAIAVPAPGATLPTLDELRTAASAQLPSWMLPDRLVAAPFLPLTPNGKVDRKAAVLLAEEAGGSREVGGGREVATARTVPAGVPSADPAAVRQAVTALWADLLELDEVPADRRFFDLGGNSLLLGRLFARLDARFPGSGVEVTDLFAHPTLDDQVRLLTAALTPSSPAAPPATAPPATAPTTAAPPAAAPDAPAGRPAPARPTRREVRRALRLGDDQR
ncbi:amino acid adenylation domain-containing protein [Streptomyces sp. NPDC001709]